MKCSTAWAEKAEWQSSNCTRLLFACRASGCRSVRHGEDFGAGITGNDLFKVHADGLTVRAEDRGDDGVEQIWLKTGHNEAKCRPRIMYLLKLWPFRSDAQGDHGLMKLKTYLYIEVSTGFLPQSDHDLLLMDNAPHHLATHDAFCGGFFYTLPDVELETVEAFAKEAHDFGFSDRFIEIMIEASAQGIQLVRFDGDGDMIEGLELIGEEEKD